MFKFNKDIGIDLGTATTLIYVQNQGIVIHEPSVAAINTRTREVIAVGEEARQMIGRTPSNIKAVKPLQEGVIADFEITEAMLKQFIYRVERRPRIFRPRVMVCIPSDVTEVEKRAVREAVEQVGARESYLIEEPRAAAIGAGINVSEPNANMVVDIGGGTSDIAVMSLGGIVVSESLRFGGDRLTHAIMRHIKEEYSLIIGERTSEEAKIQVGTAYPVQKESEKSYQVKGRDALSGLPRLLEITPADCWEAMQEFIKSLVEGVKRVLEITPPELSGDIMDRGLVLTGGGSLLDGLRRLLREETGIAVTRVENPVTCVALGAGRALESLDMLKRKEVSFGD